ncbi:hypothetical protein CPB85DRAFT_1442453 [Mucidula mucida]|nr:hypothetical protein CPB85DRAFT_1442453 [Mucidula mucida]
MPPKDKFQPKDLLVNWPCANVELNANNGRVGSLAPDGQHFITLLMDAPNIPAPPTGPIQVCAEEHFGTYDPMHAPQPGGPVLFLCHMWNVPTESDMNWRTGQLVGVGLLKRSFFVRCREAVNWAVERANIYYDAERERAQPNAKIIYFLDMCLPRLRQFLSCLESVANNLTSIHWMTMYQPVLRHERAFCDLPTLPTTLGVFTFEHHVVKMFSITPNIPVFYIRPLSHFNTQHILKVVPVVEHPSYAPPPVPYPTIFTSSSNDPAKLGLEVRFLDCFLRFRTSAFNFTPSPTGMVTNAKASSSSSSIGKFSKKPKPMDPKAHNLFEDCTRAPYSPPLHPGWCAINVEVKTNSVEEKRRLQRQCKEPLLAAKYMLPPSGLFLRDSLPDKHFSTLFAQYNHIFPALVYYITSQHFNAPALSNQEWRDVLFLARQQGTEEGQLTTRRQEALAKTAASLGDALSSSGVQFEPICPTPAGGFALLSLEEGRDAIWCLFELMFCFKLIMLDNHFRDTSDLPDANEEAAAQEDQYTQILDLFPEAQIITADASCVRKGLCLMEWAPRAERLKKLHRIMAVWRVEKPTILKAPIGTRESLQGLAQEWALTLLYAQTFYDTFERPAILPQAWWT